MPKQGCASQERGTTSHPSRTGAGTAPGHHAQSGPASLRLLGSIILALVTLLALSMLSQAQQTGTAPDPRLPSRMDVFGGYSYWSPHGKLTGVPNSANFEAIDVGSIYSVAGYINKRYGLQVEAAFHPFDSNDGASTVTAGPIVRFPKDNFTYFAHVLGGEAHIQGANQPSTGGTGYFYNRCVFGEAITAGGGVDFETSIYHHDFAVRLVQADYQYIHANYGPVTLTSGGTASLNVVRLSSGLVLHFGTIAPAPPVAYSCSANPSAVYAGEPISLSGSATNLSSKRPANYSWTSTAGKISGMDGTATIDTTNVSPGTYTVLGRVIDGPRVEDSANCSTTFTVKAYDPPTITCSAVPATVKPGESSTVTSVGRSPQNLSMTYSFSTSAGSITSTGNMATLATSGAAPGDITITCNVTDKLGQSAATTTTVAVEAPPVLPVVKTEPLCSIKFERDKRRPTRVDNEAKACLDDIALSLQRNSDAKLVVVGESDPDEKSAATLAAQRAVNTKEYFVVDKGIDGARISVRTGSTAAKGADNYMVPTGANFEADVPNTTAVDEAGTKPQPRKPLAMRKPATHEHKAADSSAHKAATTAHVHKAAAHTRKASASHRSRGHRARHRG